MSVHMTCKHCRIELTADDEDQLVVNVQAHAATHDDGHGPALTREHILARLHRLQRREQTHP